MSAPLSANGGSHKGSALNRSRESGRSTRTDSGSGGLASRGIARAIAESSAANPNDPSYTCPLTIEVGTTRTARATPSEYRVLTVRTLLSKSRHAAQR